MADDEENDFIVSILDLFEGQISLDEILSTDLDRMNSIVRAKERLIIRRIQEKKAQEAREAAKAAGKGR